MIQAVEILLIGLVIALGVIWQLNVPTFCAKVPKRSILPLLLSFVLIVGVTFRGILSICIDFDSNYDWEVLGNELLGAMSLSLLFNIKALFGPLFLAFTLSSFIYFLGEDNELKILSYFDWIFALIFRNPQEWIRNIYLLLSFIIILGGSLADTDGVL